MQDDLFSRIKKAIVELDAQNVAKLTEEVMQTGVDPIEAIQKAYMTGVRKVGDLFEAGEYFLPELVAAGAMVKEATGKIKKLIPKDKVISKGKVVLGTVQGDIHDLGKNLVGTMLSANGFEVIDIGVDCPTDKFIDQALEINAELIGASCLLTMSAPEQNKLVERLKERGLRDRFKVIIGGAAADSEWADEIGSDGYAADLAEAVQLASLLIGKTKEGE